MDNALSEHACGHVGQQRLNAHPDPVWKVRFGAGSSRWPQGRDVRPSGAIQARAVTWPLSAAELSGTYLIHTIARARR